MRRRDTVRHIQKIYEEVGLNEFSHVDVSVHSTSLYFMSTNNYLKIIRKRKQVGNVSFRYQLNSDNKYVRYWVGL